MSKWFYDLIKFGPTPLYRSFTKATVRGLENVPASGGFLLASNHTSYFDVMCLVKETPRRIRWITLEEIAAQPVLGHFVLAMNAIPVRRENTGSKALRKLIKVLRAGEIVGIFPEAGLRSVEESVLCGGEFKTGVVQMALMARVPIVPVMLLGVEQFHSWRAWLPFAGTQFTVAFGPPLTAREEVNDPGEDLRERLAGAWRALFMENLALGG